MKTFPTFILANVTKNTMYFFKKLDHHWGRKVKKLVKIFRIAKISLKWLSIGVPPFFTEFTKMTQNGLKWILNTALVNVTF